MTIGPTLETARLILRPPAAEEFDDFCAFMADEEVARYIGGTSTPPMVWRGLATIIGSWTLNGYSFFSVIEKETGEWLGRIGPWMPQGWPGTEVGWGLKRAAWGKGYAMEAAVACMDFAVDELGWTEIIHTILPENTPSIRLAERMGARKSKTVRLPEPLQHYVCDIYSQSADNWRAHRASLTAS